MALDVLRITDSGCPFAWSAEPALSALRHRYAGQINWSLAMIGLADDPSVYADRGYTGTLAAQGYARFSRNYGMPVTSAVRERPLATFPACRVVVAARLSAPEREAAVHRALQVAWFTTTDLLDEDDALIRALDGVAGINGAELVAMAGSDPAVEETFLADLEIARSAEGSPTDMQGKAATAPDGRTRYTAPSLIVTTPSGQVLEAGGFQPLEAYDVVIANADPTLSRAATDDPLEALGSAEWPLATVEVATIVAQPLQGADIEATEAALIALLGEGKVQRIAAGNGAFWALP
jgi:2-hydroxychromene-2-carboxylate isomerase